MQPDSPLSHQGPTLATKPDLTRSPTHWLPNHTNQEEEPSHS